MTRSMKILGALAAAVLVLGTGFALAIDRPWGHSTNTAAQMMNGGAGGMMGGGAGAMMGGGAGGMMGGAGMMGSAGMAPAPIAGAQEVTVTAADLRFAPSTITAKAGEAVNVVVRNTDSITHDFTVPALGVHVVVQPGGAVTFGVRPTVAGTYPFLCTVPGHAQGGMTGTIVVS